MRREARAAHRWPRLVGAVVSLVVGTGLMVTQAAAMLSAAPAEEAPAVELSDDDAAAAMFTATELTPGRGVTGCIAVTYGGDSAIVLRLFGESAQSRLARALRLIVEAGDGARFGDCSGFAGSAVYDGTLEAFTRDHHDPASGVAIPVDGTDGVAAFRFTVVLLDDNGAQGTDAEAAFTWQAEGAPAPGSTTISVPLPTTDYPTVPSSARPVEAAPSTTVGTLPAIDGEAAAASAPPRSRGTLTPLGPSRDDSVISAVVRGARYLADRAVFPAILLVIAGLFLLVQDRMDRRDPKLALAPIHPDPDLPFDR